MTNEEIAKDIAEKYCKGKKGYAVSNDYTLVDCAIVMAEYKDEYFKKVLEDKLSFFEEEYKKSHSEYMSGVCDGVRSVWNALFNK